MNGHSGTMVQAAWVAASAAAVLTYGVWAEADWTRQRMNPQERDRGFMDVHAVSSSFAVAAGVVKQGSNDAGAIFVSRDGDSWAQITPPAGGGPMDIHMYSSVFFFDESTGAVGGLGEIVVTSDGGASWTRFPMGGLLGGRAVSAITGLRPSGPLFAAVSDGELLRSIDGGITWPTLASPLGNVALGGVVFVDDDHGWVYSGASVTDDETGEVLGYADAGLARTTDGGQSWEVIFSDQARQVSALRFLDSQRGYLLTHSEAGSVLERTSDGGLTFSPMSLPQESAGGAISGFFDVWFFDGCEGWLLGTVGQNEDGTLFHTRDGGETWVEQNREFLQLGQLFGFPVQAGLIAFSFVNRDVGWASGTNETIFRYDADDGPPDCADGGGDGGGGGGGGGVSAPEDEAGRCGCRAVGAQVHGSESFLVTLCFAVFFAVALRETWRNRKRSNE